MTRRGKIATAATLAYVAGGVLFTPPLHGRIIIERAGIGVHSTGLTKSGARSAQTLGPPASPHARRTSNEKDRSVRATRQAQPRVAVVNGEDAARDARLRQEAAELAAAAAALVEKIRPALRPAGCVAAPGCDRCPYAAEVRR